MKWKSLWRKVSFGGLGKTSALEKQLEVIVYWEKKAMVPNLLGTRDQFWEHNFSTDWEWGWGWENRRQSSGGNASSHGPGGRRLTMPDMRDIILAKQVSASFWIFFFLALGWQNITCEKCWFHKVSRCSWPWCAIFTEILVGQVSLTPLEHMLEQWVALNASGELESNGGQRMWWRISVLKQSWKGQEV